MAEDKKKKEAITQAELTKGWRPRKHMQEGYRPQAQTQGASGSEKPKPPSGGSGVSPANQGDKGK
jgi:hypothetical protein